MQPLFDQQRDPDTESRKKRRQRLMSSATPPTPPTPPTPQQHSDDQHADDAVASGPPLVRPNVTTTTPRRQGDRGSTDDDGATARRLPVYCRYRDLVENGICGSWQQLSRLIADHGFPYGIMLSPNVRAWDVAEIRQWLASRPRERKILPKGAHRPRRKAATPETEQASATI
jgi:hypothetical protein